MKKRNECLQPFAVLRFIIIIVIREKKEELNNNYQLPAAEKITFSDGRRDAVTGRKGYKVLLWTDVKQFRFSG